MVTSTPLRKLFQTQSFFKMQKRLTKAARMLSIGMASTMSPEVLGIGRIAITTASGALLQHKVLHVGVLQFFLWGHLIDLKFPV